MYKSATKCNETLSKWCKNKHGASKIIDTFETYQASSPRARSGSGSRDDSRPRSESWQGESRRWEPSNSSATEGDASRGSRRSRSVLQLRYPWPSGGSLPDNQVRSLRETWSYFACLPGAPSLAVHCIDLWFSVSWTGVLPFP
jgi:hypothetical protein